MAMNLWLPELQTTACANEYPDIDLNFLRELRTTYKCKERRVSGTPFFTRQRWNIRTTEFGIFQEFQTYDPVPKHFLRNFMANVISLVCMTKRPSEYPSFRMLRRIIAGEHSVGKML